MDLLTNPFKTSPEEEARLAEQAKNFLVKKIPYRGESRTLRYDSKNSNYCKRGGPGGQKLVGKGNIAGSDFANGMHMEHRVMANSLRLEYTPTFSTSDELLRLVIAQNAYQYICASWQGVRQVFGGSQRVPEELVERRDLLEKLCEAVLEKWRARAHAEESVPTERHVYLTTEHKNYVAVRAFVAYRAWRQAKDATTIANEMGVSVSRDWVRQLLNRLCWTARRLGLETFEAHHSCKWHVWKLDYNQKTKEILKYPEPSWKGTTTIDEVVEQLLLGTFDHLIPEPETQKILIVKERQMKVQQIRQEGTESTGAMLFVDLETESTLVTWELDMETGEPIPGSGMEAGEWLEREPNEQEAELLAVAFEQFQTTGPTADIA